MGAGRDHDLLPPLPIQSHSSTTAGDKKSPTIGGSWEGSGEGSVDRAWIGIGKNEPKTKPKKNTENRRIPIEPSFHVHGVVHLISDHHVVACATTMPPDRPTDTRANPKPSGRGGDHQIKPVRKNLSTNIPPPPLAPKPTTRSRTLPSRPLPPPPLWWSPGPRRIP